MFSDLRSDSVALRLMWYGLPERCFQSISNCTELFLIWSNARRVTMTMESQAMLHYCIGKREISCHWCDFHVWYVMAMESYGSGRESMCAVYQSKHTLWWSMFYNCTAGLNHCRSDDLVSSCMLKIRLNAILTHLLTWTHLKSSHFHSFHFIHCHQLLSLKHINRMYLI